jgi:hypothetical protein
MGKWVHRLSNIDTQARTAICAECGPVHVRWKDKRRWRCLTAINLSSGSSARSKRRRRNIKKLSAVHGTKCAICKADADRLMVDHCHETEAVRGLLCMACNFGLGWFKDNPDALRNAASYVEAHRG